MIMDVSEVSLDLFVSRSTETLACEVIPNRLSTLFVVYARLFRSVKGILDLTKSTINFQLSNHSRS